LPRRSATAASRRATVGSSPYTSSPTGASAIALRMAAVGFVTVSLRRSMGSTPASLPSGRLGVMDAEAASAALARAWREADRVVVLTGAGMSTASGIPDFRSPGGRWERYQPVPIQDFLASEEARAEYWRYKGETWRLLREARPNPAHLALAGLAAADRLSLLVTQNVDGLHERSGIPAERLVRIHGTDASVVCTACGACSPREGAQALWESGVAVPRCGCGGALKPATISFGQSLVAEDLERALRAASQCDLFVAAGSSLVVSPVNRMFPLARAGGARTAIVTVSETPFDDEAEIRIAEPVERVLPEVARAVRA
jgi:NAD-dependent deacetylase